MKTILVDAINGLILEDGTVFAKMHELLETYPNKKVVLAGANDEQFKEYNLDKSPYPVFTLKHNPEKTDPKYFELLLSKFKLSPDDVVYFEHCAEAVKSAESLGIKTYFYDHKEQDIATLKKFLGNNLS